MKTKTSLLLSALAAAALLAGCRTTQNNHASRGLMGGSTASSRRAQPARVRPAAASSASTFAPAASKPVAVSERPLGFAPAAQPQPAPSQPAPVARPASVVPSQPAPVARPASVVAPQTATVAQPPTVAQPGSVVAPPPAPATQPQAAAQPAAPAVPAAPTLTTYKVKRGDIAGRIANSHGMTLKEFLEANGMTLEQANKLREGSKVKVWSNQEALKPGPAVRPPQASASDDPNVHVVKAGETLGSISAKTGVPVATLMKLNNIDDPNLIREGRHLVLRSGATTPAAETPKKTPAAEGTKKTPAAEGPKTEPAPTASNKTPKKTPAAESPKRTSKKTPAAETKPPEQDAAVPPSQVKVADTDVSLEELLGGISLTEAKEQAAETRAPAPQPAQATPSGANGSAGTKSDGYIRYIVQPNENLYHLGARFKVPFKTLRELNNLPPSLSKLEPGTVLLIPENAATAP